jgi:hypothetical protein
MDSFERVITTKNLSAYSDEQDTLERYAKECMGEFIQDTIQTRGGIAMFVCERIETNNEVRYRAAVVEHDECAEIAKELNELADQQRKCIAQLLDSKAT